MNFKLATLLLMGGMCFTPAQPTIAAEQPNVGRANRAPFGAVQTDRFRTAYIRLGSNNDDGLLYEPVTPGPNARIGIVYEHPGDNNFNVEVGPEMANRGYRVLMVNFHGNRESHASYAPGISNAIKYLRTLSGVQKVVVAGHSGGGHLIAFYANVAENGPAGCQGPQMIYPCKSEPVTGLAKPDGVVLLDPTLGAFHATSAIDPSWDGKQRQAALDMFAAGNGYDAKSGTANYSAEFAKRFHAGQSARNMQLIDNAAARLKLIEQGKGQFTDNEPLVIPAASDGGQGIRLYHADLKFVSHTKKPHMLLKADGSQPEVVVHSVRPATASRVQRTVGSFDSMAIHTTVRDFLANYALRTTPEFAIKEDDIVGVDWKSSMMSSPGSAQGINVPTLVLTMSCHYLVVPGEIIYDHLAAKDKTYASVEGAVHGFTPCKPEYGDTTKRTFDFVDDWLTKSGRF